jgi:thioredoxin reductase
LLIDAGGQSNLPAEGVGGLLGHDGQSPAALYAAAHRELAAYPAVEVRQGEVVSGSRFEGRVDLRLLDGSQCRARRLLLATGMDYERSAGECPVEWWDLRASSPHPRYGTTAPRAATGF